MPSDSGNQRSAVGGPPPPNTEPLPCPRCDSTSTKFCYYNNYNLSQPRHFCKSCRRYWTHGGTLRDVPVGGGTRKKYSNSKRSRSSSSPSASSSSSSCSSTSSAAQFEPILPAPKPISVLAGVNQDMVFDNVNLNENISGGTGSFASLLGSHGSAGFLALGGYGPGIGLGYEDQMGGVGFGKGVWASYPEQLGDLVGSYGGYGSCSTGAPLSSTSSGYKFNTWQLPNGSDGGVIDGDGLAWPDLAISMQTEGSK